MVTDERLSIKEGAIATWGRRGSTHQKQLAALAEHYGFDPFAPFSELSAEVRTVILEGSGDETIPKLGKKPHVEGVLPMLRRKLRDAEQRAASDDDGDGPLGESTR